MHLVLVGLSHKTAPVAIREKLTFSAAVQEDALNRLARLDGIREAVIVSTCNRTEVYAVASSEDGGVESVIAFLADYHDLDRHELSRYLYVITGDAVVRHLFRVVASLDSMVVGEAQILGQVKEAYEHGFNADATSRVFNKLFRQSFEVGKRVRTETAIGEAAVSISYAAVELAKKVFDTLDGRTILILGAGKMSELTAKHLVSNGVARVLVVNRTFERAQEMAARFSGTAVPYESLYEAVRESDIVISSTAATEYVVTKRDLAPVSRTRTRPLFLIDIAVPRDIDPAVNDLGGVFLYDIDDLNGVVSSNLEERMSEAHRAEGIIDEEITAFYAWVESMEVVPTVAAIRAKAEVIREMELEKALKRLDLGEKDRKTVEALTCAIVNKMLHGPTARLKKAAAGKDGYEYMEMARALYGLEDSEEKSGPGAFRNLLNLRAREIVDKQKETGDNIGDCGA
ncbi:MAG: glutamyl-tRNA reductase [Coriobacteriia bacterium]|nr:glutamyl-tRNA reductase [Coriobacteriia bacterium]